MIESGSPVYRSWQPGGVTAGGDGGAGRARSWARAGVWAWGARPCGPAPPTTRACWTGACAAWRARAVSGMITVYKLIDPHYKENKGYIEMMTYILLVCQHRSANKNVNFNYRVWVDQKIENLNLIYSPSKPKCHEFFVKNR